MNEKQKQLNDFRIALARSNGYVTIKRPGFIDYIDIATGEAIAMEITHQDDRESDYVVIE